MEAKSMGQDEMDAVLTMIRGRRRFLVTSHARPDGDALGSVLAMCMLLEQMGKECVAVMADGVPVIYRGLPGVERIQRMAHVDERFDAAVLLECDSVERTGLTGLTGQFLVNIDHHESAKMYGALNWVDTKACAVAEMVYRLVKAAGVRMDAGMATCLYTAVLTDTGAFSYRGTDATTFALAEELVRCGAEPSEIARQVYFSNPASKMHLLGRVLRTLHTDGELAWAWVTREDMQLAGAAEEDCEGAVNYLIGIAGVEAAVFLREMKGEPETYRLSLRGKGKVDVAQVAERFGGGGHRNASGCTMEGPLAAVTERIASELRRSLGA